MIGRSFLRSTLSNYFIQRMITAILISKINENMIKNNKFIIIKIAFEEINNKEYLIKNVIIAKLYVIDDFNVNLLIENNVLISKNIIVDLDRRKLIINNCEDFEILIRIKTRKNFYVKRIIYIKQIYIIMLDKVTEISIT